jgi:hypothetical protein
MRLIGFSFVKSNENQGEFVLTRAYTFVAGFTVSGRSGYSPVQSDQVLGVGSMIRLHAAHTNGNNVFTSCLMALYLIPVHSNPDLLGERHLNVLTFGGNVPTERRSTLLRFGAQANTGLDTNMNYVGTMFTIPAPMRLFCVGYQKSAPNFDTTLQFYKNGQPWDNVTCHLWRDGGISDFRFPDDSPLRQLEAGDVIQLAYERGIMPGVCLITLYTTQGRRLGPNW